MKINQRLVNAILRESSLAWWEWDRRDNRVTFNDLKATMLGYDPRDFEGKGYEVFTNLLHPDDYEKAMNAMRDLLEGRKGLYQVDYRILDAAGHYHWYMDRGTAISFEAGRIARIRGVVIDLGLEDRSGSNIEAVANLLRKFSEDNDKLVIICSVCERIKITEQEWTPATDDLIRAIPDALSHGICPDCLLTLYSDFSKHRLPGNS